MHGSPVSRLTGFLDSSPRLFSLSIPFGDGEGGLPKRATTCPTFHRTTPKLEQSGTDSPKRQMPQKRLPSVPVLYVTGLVCVAAAIPRGSVCGDVRGFQDN
jgi:hypothetical protein